jgi:hypothetical protein
MLLGRGPMRRTEQVPRLLLEAKLTDLIMALQTRMGLIEGTTPAAPALGAAERVEARANRR